MNLIITVYKKDVLTFSGKLLRRGKTFCFTDQDVNSVKDYEITRFYFAIVFRFSTPLYFEKKELSKVVVLDNGKRYVYKF